MKAISAYLFTVLILFSSAQIVKADESNTHSSSESSVTYGDEYHRKVSIHAEADKGFEAMRISFQKSFHQKPEVLASKEHKQWLADLIGKSKCVDDTMRDYVKLFYGPGADPTIQSILKLEGISSVTPKIFISLEPRADGTPCDVPGLGTLRIRPYLSVTDSSIDALTSKLKIPQVSATVPYILSSSYEQNSKLVVDPDLADKVMSMVKSELVTLKLRYKEELKNIEIQENHPVFKAIINK